MPVYEFECLDCHKTFETAQSIANFDPGKVECPHCGGKKIDRIWSRVFAVTSKKS
jgi:putative FmdB family regulatory protein